MVHSWLMLELKYSVVCMDVVTCFCSSCCQSSTVVCTGAVTIWVNSTILVISLPQFIAEMIGGIVSKETVCCVGGKVKH